ncbi:MAG: ribosome maturation factor RimP [Desulfonatronovibrio sp.]
MSKQDTKNTVSEIVQTNCQIMGLELWGIEYFPGPGGKKGIVRIYIDSEQGVNIDQCAELSRQLSVVFDVEDIIPGSYSLEVSSPGLDRLFFRLDQLVKYIGQKLKISLKKPLDGRKKFTGILSSVQQETVVIEHDSQQLEFDWNQIDKARLVG